MSSNAAHRRRPRWSNGSRQARPTATFRLTSISEALTSYLYAILQGMAVQAGSGATREDLERVVDTSLAMWPSR